jgi:hypothetical protein
MKSTTMIYKMKRTKIFLLAATAVFVLGMSFSNKALSQTRTKITDGLTLIRNGDEYGIEDDIHQKTWWITISREKKIDNPNSSSKSIGEWVYYVTCGNNYSKNVLKYSLSGAITGAVAYTGIGTFFAGVAGVISTTIYDDVCKYFGEKK